VGDAIGVSPQDGDATRTTHRLFLGNRFDLRQHLLHPAANLLALFTQPHHLTAQALEFFFAFFQLLPQALRIALGCGSSLSSGLVQFNGAIDFLFERLKIVGRNLSRYPFSHSHGHDATTS
jgi:hypothetical protein